MQFKSFMEALKGNQHKIDKNKNGKIDAHDFKLLQKEEESEERMARADYRVSASGRKSHKEIVFNSGEEKEKKPMVGEEMSDDQMKKREEIVKSMKKDKAGFKDRYGDRAETVMYATATKMAMKEEAEELDEKSDQAKRNKTMKNMMDASRGARYKLNNLVPDAEPEHKTARAHNVAIGRSLRKEEAEELDELSKSTLGSYVKKASRDSTITRKIASDFEHMSDRARTPGMKQAAGENAQRYKEKSWKRRDGLDKAVDRLTKEEVEVIDELSKSTLGSYAKKASRDAVITRKIGADFENRADRARSPGMKAASNEISQKYKEKSWKRRDGVEKAVDRLTKEEIKKDDVPFDGPYTKAQGTTKDKSGAVHTPMSRAKHLAKMAMKKQMKEDIDRLFEAKDEQEYGYEGDMALNQLATLIRCAEMIKDTLKPDTDLPEWVQSKITLASDYIVTAADYLHSELDEQAPVAPVPGMKFKDHAVMVHPETKSRVVIKRKNIDNYTSDGYKEVRPGQKLKEDEEVKFSYTELMMINEIKLADLPVRRIKGNSYGADYSDPEGADDYDDKKPMKPTAEKRGRGRPAGSQSGARKNFGSSKLHTK